jgi:beta-hydroxylase
VFHDPARFPFTAALEANWRAIHAEYQGVAGESIDWFEKELYGEGWRVLGLFDFPHGRPIPANTARCPVTTSVIERHVPRHGAAGFSILKSGTRVRPHRGYPGDFLRCHLALKVPEGDCALKVGGETRGWEKGKALVFDDRLWHEAWNLTDCERVVLLFDFVPEG